MISVGSKVQRRRFRGLEDPDQIGTVRKVNRKWRTVLIYWPEKDRDFWHSIDDVYLVYESE